MHSSPPNVMGLSMSGGAPRADGDREKSHPHGRISRPSATHTAWNEIPATSESDEPDRTDAAVLDRARHGDAAAFRLLVDRHAGHLFAAAVSLVGCEADAEDVLQETFAGAYRGLNRFEGRSSVRTWLTGILVRQAAMHRRRTARREKRRGRPSPAADAGRSVPARTGASDTRIDVMAAVASLSEPHRQVIVLRELEGLTYDEIAETLGIPRGTVESRLFRARRRLQERLTGYFD